MYKHFHKRTGVLAPNAEMWHSLQQGRLLRQILSDFYEQVYADPYLSPFFTEVSIERAIDKQYSFLRSIFTGEKSYFGDHPKNAHHWMVISDELFDYRENLLVTTLRKHNLPEHLIQLWRNLDEVFRRAIVKDSPIPRRIGEFELPLEGYCSITLEVSSLCDGCGAEIANGTIAYYHQRTGKLNCSPCQRQTDNTEQVPTTCPSPNH